jgi:N-carbamoyl-L-amino-acid hydrolase
MFKMITDIIREKGNGSRAYHSATTVARKAALADPERAAGYFILAVAAQEFADLHYGEATQADVFDRELDRFQNAVDTLDLAFGGSDADQKLKAISMMAIHFIAGEQGQQL